MGDVKGSTREFDPSGALIFTEGGKTRMNDHVFGGAIAIGYDFNKRLGAPVRLELEYALYSDAKAKDSGHETWSNGAWERDSSTTTIGVQTLFANAYFDFHNSSAFTPYVGFGLGMSFVNVKSKGSESWDYTPWGGTRAPKVGPWGKTPARISLGTWAQAQRMPLRITSALIWATALSDLARVRQRSESKLMSGIGPRAHK